MSVNFSDENIVILTAVPDLLTAKRIAHNTVEHYQAACAHILPQGLSVFMWEGVLHAEQEHQIILKTTKLKQQACIDEIRKAHPYEVPEIIVLPITAGLPEYLAWLQKSTEHV